MKPSHPIRASATPRPIPSLERVLSVAAASTLAAIASGCDNPFAHATQSSVTPAAAGDVADRLARVFSSEPIRPTTALPDPTPHSVRAFTGSPHPVASPPVTATPPKYSHMMVAGGASSVTHYRPAAGPIAHRTAALDAARRRTVASF